MRIPIRAPLGLVLVAVLSCATPRHIPVATPALALPRVENVQRHVAVIDLAGAIDDTTAERMSDIFAHIQFGPEPVDEVVIRIHSPGGMVTSAWSIAKDIVASPVPTTCVVDTWAASAAFFILQACETRVVVPGSVLMVHEAKVVLPEGAPMAPADLAEYEALEKRANEVMSGAQCHRLRVSLEECRARYRGREWWMGPLEALKIGAADAWAPSIAYVIQTLAQTPKDP